MPRVRGIREPPEPCKAHFDPVWYDHLPYIDFPKNWPIFSPKDTIGDWLEFYTKVMELNY